MAMSDPSNETLSVVEVTASDMPAPGTIFCPNPKMRLWNAHPRVYFDIGTTGEARCPYCGTRYRLKAGEAIGAH